MKTYARIQDGRVVEKMATDLNPAGLFHPSLNWQLVDPALAGRLSVNWLHSDGVFSPPEPAPPAEPLITIQVLKAQADALAAAVAAFSQRT